MTTYEQLIVHALRDAPALVRTEGLGEKLFTSPDCRNLFSGISDLFEENGAAGPVDLAILSAKSGVSLERIVDIEAGCYFPTGKNFEDWVRAQQTEVDKVEWAKLYEKESQAYVKTGIVDLASVARIREHCDKLLSREKAGTRPEDFLMTGAQLQALDVSVEWTLDKLIPARSLTLLHGPGGLGKTWLSLAIGKAVSEGVPFLGLPTKRRPVIYIDFENPWPMLIDRVRRLDITDVRFWHLSARVRPPKLDSDDWTLYKSLPAGSLLIFDTARASHDGDENSSQDVGLVMNRLKEIREIGNDVLLLHHTTKVNERASKGSTAWEDLADHVLAFFRVKRGTLEEIDEGGYDPDALLSLGTGKKTRYEPARLYVTLDPAAGGFALAENPDASAIDAIADYIAQDGSKNQSEIIAWAKIEGIGPKMRQSFVALLNRGETAGRWASHKAGVRRIYEPAF